MQLPGEHAHCGPPLDLESGFTYSPQTFMDNNSEKLIDLFWGMHYISRKKRKPQSQLLLCYTGEKILLDFICYSELFFFPTAARDKFKSNDFLLNTRQPCNTILIYSFSVYFYNFGMPDFGVSSLVGIIDGVKVLAFAVKEGRVAVHCHAGLGRTGKIKYCIQFSCSKHSHTFF